jgi:hypothetical protein
LPASLLRKVIFCQSKLHFAPQIKLVLEKLPEHLVGIACKVGNETMFLDFSTPQKEDFHA